MSALDELDDYSKALLWSLGALKQLAEWHLTPPLQWLTIQGVAAWDQLDAGWKPTDAMLRECVSDMFGDDSVLLSLLKCFRDDRERMCSRFEGEPR